MTTLADRSRDEVLSPQEKQDRLNELTDKYFRGEIELDQFLAARGSYSLDFEAFIAELASRQKGPTHTEFDRYTEAWLRTLQSVEERESPFLLWFRRTFGQGPHTDTSPDTNQSVK